MITVQVLGPAIEAGWGVDTTSDPANWSPESSARGQCVVTSLVVQHLLGGELQKVTTVFQGAEESHYYNILPDGTKVDLSRKQYPQNQQLVVSNVNLHGFPSVREKMLHERETKSRYELLLSRVLEAIQV